MKRVRTEADREKAIEADKAACYRYAIMRHLRKNFGINARTPWEAMAALLGLLALTVYKAVGKSAAGETDWQGDIDDMIECCVEALTAGE